MLGALRFEFLDLEGRLGFGAWDLGFPLVRGQRSAPFVPIPTAEFQLEFRRVPRARFLLSRSRLQRCNPRSNRFVDERLLSNRAHFGFHES